MEKQTSPLNEQSHVLPQREVHSVPSQALYTLGKHARGGMSSAGRRKQTGTVGQKEGCGPGRHVAELSGGDVSVFSAEA